jgi:hypothetical protein
VSLSNLTSTRPRSASGDSFGTSSSLGTLRLSNYVPPASPPMTPRSSTAGSRPPLPTFGPIVGMCRSIYCTVFDFLITDSAQVDNQSLPQPAQALVVTLQARIPATHMQLLSKSGVSINPPRHRIHPSPLMPGVHLSMAPPMVPSIVMVTTKHLAKW